MNRIIEEPYDRKILNDIHILYECKNCDFYITEINYQWKCKSYGLDHEYYMCIWHKNSNELELYAPFNNGMSSCIKVFKINKNFLSKEDIIFYNKIIHYHIILS